MSYILRIKLKFFRYVYISSKRYKPVLVSNNVVSKYSTDLYECSQVNLNNNKGEEMREEMGVNVMYRVKCRKTTWQRGNV